MTMNIKPSITPSITVVLANRPRLFRELLQHALRTASRKFHVVEATNGMPTTAVLRDAHWLIVDEEMAAEANKLASAHSHLGVLALDGRGGRMHVLALSEQAGQPEFSEVPTLSELIRLLSQEHLVADANGVS
jgi:hypothetical protein